MYRQSRPPSHCRISRTKAYHRPLKVVRVLLKLPQGLILRIGTFDYRPYALLPNIFENRPQLVGRGRIFRDVELELRLVGVRLMRVIAGLVLCSGLRRIGRCLLQ